MFGVVAGRAAGAVPALELTLAYGALDLYSESEYVIEFHDTSDSFYYNWSELSASADWLSGGLVIQRTRQIHTSRDIQRGLFARLTSGRIDGAVYFFNPGSDDDYYVASVAIPF